jgi:hypothetical protein
MRSLNKGAWQAGMGGLDRVRVPRPMRRRTTRTSDVLAVALGRGKDLCRTYGARAGVRRIPSLTGWVYLCRDYDAHQEIRSRWPSGVLSWI